MTRRNFHLTAYGWNYFAEFSSTGKVRFGRYHTNGHVNSDTQKTNWVDIQKADVVDLKKVLEKEQAGEYVSDTLKYNANIECQRGLEQFS